MGKPERITFEASAEIADGLRSAVSSGEFASTEDALTEAVHHWLIGRCVEKPEASALQRRLPAWLDGPGIDAGVVFTRLEAKYKAMIDAQERGE